MCITIFQCYKTQCSHRFNQGIGLLIQPESHRYVLVCVCVRERERVIVPKGYLLFSLFCHCHQQHPQSERKPPIWQKNKKQKTPICILIITHRHERKITELTEGKGGDEWRRDSREVESRTESRSGKGETHEWRRDSRGWLAEGAPDGKPESPFLLFV